MNGFAGTWRLTRLALRRDRITLPAWVLALGAFVAATTAMFASSLATYDTRVLETRLVATNAGMRLLGITSGPTVGGYMLHREFVTLAALAALMSTFAVMRHTRQNEELGRAEMLGATVVGRYAGLTAAVLVAVLADLALAVVLGLAVVVGGQPVAGAFLAGAAVASVGLVFVGVAAVTGQLVPTTRAASGLAALVLAVSFALSGIGNMLGTVDARGLSVTSAWPSWLSPIGWGQQTRPFDTAEWWPLGLCLALLAGLLALAAALVRRRDVGRGLWAERRGRAHASAVLSGPGGLGPVGLVWRLQRGVLAAWAVTLGIFGLIFGSLTQQVLDAGDELNWYADVGPGTHDVLDGFRVSMVQFAGMFVGLYVVQVLLRVRADESGGTLEPVLAGSVSRVRWIAAHLVNATAGAALLLVAFGACMGLTAGQVIGHTGRQVAELTGAALGHLPGVLVLGAAVVLVVALFPRHATAAGWSLAMATFVVGPMFGPGLDLPLWVQRFSPFTHTPKLPAVALDPTPIVSLLLVSALLAAAAVVVLRRRDLHLPA